MRSAFRNILKIVFISGKFFSYNSIFAHRMKDFTDLLKDGIMVGNKRVMVYIFGVLGDSVERPKYTNTMQWKFQNFTISYGSNGENMGLIKNIYKIKEQVYLLVQKFQKKENLINNELLESSLNKFFWICNLTSDQELLKIEDIYRKCVIVIRIINLIYLFVIVC